MLTAFSDVNDNDSYFQKIFLNLKNLDKSEIDINLYNSIFLMFWIQIILFYRLNILNQFKNNSYLYNKKIKKALNAKSVANEIIHFINNSKKKALFLPKKYKFALIFYYFIKTFNILKWKKF